METVKTKALNKRKRGKKTPLAFQYCDFIRFLKGKSPGDLQSIVKNLPTPLINLLSEIIHNGICGNLTRDPKKIQKLKPFKGLMEKTSTKKTGVQKRKKLLHSKRGAGLLSVILPIAASVIAALTGK